VISPFAKRLFISPCVPDRTDGADAARYNCGQAAPSYPTIPLRDCAVADSRDPRISQIAGRDSSTMKWGAQMNTANPNRERKRILMVEDHEDDWELVALQLRDYRFTFARDFDEGLRLAQRGYFDLYILDNWLPDGSGIGLCRLIREFDPHTPILFYSGAGYERDIQEALRSGAQAYLVKPVIPNDLERAVTRLTSPVSESDSEAWRAEIATIREELAIHYKEQVERMEGAKEKRLRAEEKLMRLKAEKAFLAAGGTRGEFARRWPSVFVDEVRSRRGS
jgi:DNA-binding response OmpR family regulator